MADLTRKKAASFVQLTDESAGATITSTISGSKRGIDVNVLNQLGGSVNKTDLSGALITTESSLMFASSHQFGSLDYDSIMYTKQGNGSYSQDTNSVKLTVNTAATDSVIYKSHYQIDEYCGEDISINFCLKIGSQVNNNIKTWGVYSSRSAAYFKRNSSGIFFEYIINNTTTTVDLTSLATWDDDKISLWGIYFEKNRKISLYINESLIKEINISNSWPNTLDLLGARIECRNYNQADIAQSTDLNIFSTTVFASRNANTLAYVNTIRNSCIRGINEKTTSFYINLEDISKHQLKNSDIVSTLTSANNRILQLFKYDSTTINKFCGELEPHVSTLLIDDFESYTSNSDISNSWVPSDRTNTWVRRETSSPLTGSVSMHMRIRKNRSEGDTITYTFSSVQDMTNVVKIELQYKATSYRSESGFDFSLVDINGYSATAPLDVTQLNVAETKYILTEDMVVDDINFDFSQISKIVLTCISDSSTKYFWMDELYTITGKGYVKIELLDFNTNSSPTNLSDGTPIVLESGMTYALKPVGSSIIDCNINAKEGPSENKLTPGNYYGLVLSHYDIDVDIKGCSSCDTAISGSFSTVNSSGDLSVVPNTSMKFLLTGKTKGIIKKIKLKTIGTPNFDKITVYVTDGEYTLLPLIVDQTLTENENNIELSFDLKNYYFLNKELYLRVDYNKAQGSTVANLIIDVDFINIKGGLYE